MAVERLTTFPALEPNLQVSFYHKLLLIKKLCFHEALGDTVGRMAPAELDSELSAMVPQAALAKVASFGLRGEVLFPIPSVLGRNPSLLGYYRLLYGLSQKEFYGKGAFGRFRCMEADGELRGNLAALIPSLCRSMISTGVRLVEGVDRLSLQVVNDLQLLTLGPQLRGEENTRIGQKAGQQVYALIRSLVHNYLKESTARTLIIENDSGRSVLIEFASDPDVRITEELTDGIRPLVSIEIKGGTDSSNIHNRLGEAEKSHQKARARGFFEFWTLLRVDVSKDMAHRESPTTSHFFYIEPISDPSTIEHRQFRDLLCSILGIRSHCGKQHHKKA